MSAPQLQQEADRSLLDASLSICAKDYIISQFWDCDARQLGDPHYDVSLSAYWEYYFKQCRQALHDNGRHVSVRTHRDILNIAKYLKKKCSRKEIREYLWSTLSSATASGASGDRLLDRSIDLTASLLLMLEFGGHVHGFSGHTQLHWDNSSSLEGFVGHYFEQPPVLGNEGVKLQRTFNARSLERIAGMNIVWTNNLADHLRLTDDDSTVEIFHHSTFLEAQRGRSMLPPGLAEETLRTLALLFPGYPTPSTRTKKWLSNFPTTLNIDACVIQCGHLKTSDRQIERFVFWHDRLVTLKQVYDEAHPRNLSQWWHDRRNGAQWYGFWVALTVLILTLLFGLIQCIEGAMQVRYSYLALHSDGRPGQSEFTTS